MTKTTVETVDGSATLVLSTGEKVQVRALSLRDLQRAMDYVQEQGAKNPSFRQTLNALSALGPDADKFDLATVLPMILPAALHFPELFAEPCGKKPEWLRALPLADLVAIIDKILELSRLEELLPGFISIWQRLRRAWGRVPRSPTMQAKSSKRSA